MNLEVLDTDAGSLYVDRAAAERGSEAPFFHVYADADAETRWGYFCGNCETVDNAMDTMGRIACNRCENIRKPEEWDAAHE
ncbi:DUF5816 domain-containing protein [Halobaculum sp. D14]|uniref:DUF5816 domain-containing protein n=1 Tax=unclassified Halobaculum TaxID=2640896 RepID=UPI003EC07D87